MKFSYDKGEHYTRGHS